MPARLRQGGAAGAARAARGVVPVAPLRVPAARLRGRAAHAARRAAGALPGSTTRCDRLVSVPVANIRINSETITEGKITFHIGTTVLLQN